MVEDRHELESMSCKEQMKLILSLWIRKMSLDSFPVEIFTLIVNRFAYHRQMDQNCISIEFNENNEALLKVLVIGSERVGKTALFKQYVDDQFIETYRPTIGADFMIKNIPFGSDPKRQLELQIWDTAGQESFQSFGVAFYRGSDIVLLCYDITNRKSLMEIKEKWNPELNDIVDEKGILKILVGTKCDLKKEKMCSAEDVSDIVAECKLDGALECSAKDKINIDRMLTDILADNYIESEHQKIVAKFPFRS